MNLTEILLIITQIELLIIIFILIYMLRKQKHKKPDHLLKHFKEYIAEGYTIGQAKEKLGKIGFSKEQYGEMLKFSFGAMDLAAT